MPKADIRRFYFWKYFFAKIGERKEEAGTTLIKEVGQFKARCTPLSFLQTKWEPKAPFLV